MAVCRPGSRRTPPSPAPAAARQDRQDRLPGLEQEIWALLALYQLLRMAMADAIQARPGTDPDRASFTPALGAARDQLIVPRESAPMTPLTSPAPSAAQSWPRCCPATVPASSNAPHPATTKNDDSRPRLPAAITAIDMRCTPPVLRQDTTPGSAADPATAHHPDHDQPAATGMERSRTRPAPGCQAPQHAHPARRMGQARLHHRHRRQLCAQHAEPTILNKRPRPLTSRHWLRAPVTRPPARSQNSAAIRDSEQTQPSLRPG